MMADNVQWIKIKVGMFDGDSFKKIKKAKIGGVPFRDKLTSVWFELLDLAGKSNQNGALIDGNEVPFHNYEDIAIMLDREEKEIELCMLFYIKEQMVEIIDDIYYLSNFVKYQSVIGLEKIREQRRISQQKWREKKKLQLLGNINHNNTDYISGENDVDSTVDSTDHLHSIIDNISNSSFSSNSYSSISKRFIKPTIEQIEEYANGKGYELDAEHFFAFYESNGWRVGKNPMKSWQGAVANWVKRQNEYTPRLKKTNEEIKPQRQEVSEKEVIEALQEIKRLRKG